MKVTKLWNSRNLKPWPAEFKFSQCAFIVDILSRPSSFPIMMNSVINQKRMDKLLKSGDAVLCNLKKALTQDVFWNLDKDLGKWYPITTRPPEFWLEVAKEKIKECVDNILLIREERKLLNDEISGHIFRNLQNSDGKENL